MNTNLEIGRFLRALGKRIIILVLAPALAVGLVLAYRLTRPEAYRATVSFVPPTIEADATPAVVTQFSADLREAMRSDVVIDQVSQAAHVSRATAREKLSVLQRGSSVLFRIRFENKQPELAEAAVSAAVEGAMELILTPVQASANRRFDAADARLDEATAAQDVIREETGTPLPEERYRALLTEVSSLRVALEQARATGAASVGGLQTAIEQRQDDLAELAPAVVRFTRVTQDADSASREVDAARLELQRIDGISESIQSGEAVGAPTLAKLSRADGIERDVATAGVLGLLFGLAIVAYFRPQTERADDETAAGPFAPHRDGDDESPTRMAEVSAPHR